MGEQMAISPESTVFSTGQDNDRTFHIGLAMAGAVSAGAYTAGVLDVLIRALEAWQVAKDKGDKQVPDHSVCLTSMAGASAGGITAALGSIGLGKGIETAKFPAASGGTITTILPILYNAWVLKPRMVSDDNQGPSLLGLDDLQGQVISALDTTVLDSIRQGAVSAPAAKTTAPKAYMAEPMHIYLTVSNLRGTPYQISFGSSTYKMLDHNDRRLYRISGLGKNTAAASPWASADAAVEMTVGELNDKGGPSAKWLDLSYAALATSAFPVGLSSRILTVNQSDYANRQWPLPGAVADKMNPSWPQAFNPTNGDLKVLTVDGGMLNNEPFDYVRYALMAKGADQNARKPEEADRAVIMIAPFPEGVAFPLDDAEESDRFILKVVSKLIPTLLAQVRFKPDELASAADPNVASRVLIAPRRTADGIASSANIACGLLGGFGGFFDQRFREHDFVLGQRNAQQFLREWFSLPDNNVVVRPKADGALGQPDSSNNLRIIPLVGEIATEIPQPEWPRMSQQDFGQTIAAINVRAGKVMDKLLGDVQGFWKKQYLKLGWSQSQKDVMAYIKLSILADLLRRDQIDDGLSSLQHTDDRRLRNFSSEERQVLGAMSRSGCDYRTVATVSKQLGFNPLFVESTLNRASQLPDAAIHKVIKKDPCDGSGGKNIYRLNYLGDAGWFVFSNPVIE